MDPVGDGGSGPAVPARSISHATLKAPASEAGSSRGSHAFLLSLLLFWIPSDASVASRHLPHGPHGLGQDRSRARTGSDAALRAGQRRFRPGLSRDGYRYRQTLGATAGGL